MIWPLRGFAVALAALAALTCALYVWRTPAGLPYDEPAHWQTVTYYADHHRLPTLGDQGTTYEAQQGPLVYVVDAITLRALTALGASTQTAFYGVRLLGALEFSVAAVFLFLLVSRMAPIGVAAAAAILFAANPMFAAMSGSVQNDTLALALGFGVLEMALRHLRRPAIPAATAIGALAGGALLAKLTAWVVIPAVAVWLLYAHRRTALKAVAAFVTAAAGVAGWWFVRNQILYGDVTGARAVSRVGVSFPRSHLDAHTLGATFEEAVTYLWLPTEYLRNTISASSTLKAGVVLLTVLIVVSALWARRRVAWEFAVAAAAVMAVVTWLVTRFAFQDVAARVAYLALPLWIAAAAAALATRRSVAFPVALTIVLALNTWTLHAIGTVPTTPPERSMHHVLSHEGR